MSHLRPNDPKTGNSKPLKDYSDSEKLSALTQMDDAARTRIGANKPVDKRTAQTMVDLAEGTEKAENLPQEVVEAATAPVKKN